MSPVTVELGRRPVDRNGSLEEWDSLSLLESGYGVLPASLRKPAFGRLIQIRMMGRKPA